MRVILLCVYSADTYAWDEVLLVVMFSFFVANLVFVSGLVEQRSNECFRTGEVVRRLDTGKKQFNSGGGRVIVSRGNQGMQTSIYHLRRQREHEIKISSHLQFRLGKSLEALEREGSLFELW